MKLVRTATIIMAALMLMGCAALMQKKATHKVIVNVKDFSSPVSVMIPVEWPNFFELPYKIDNVVPFSRTVAAIGFRNSEDSDDFIALGLVIIGDVINPYAIYYKDIFYIYPKFDGPPVTVNEVEFDVFHRKILDLEYQALNTI